LARYSVHHLRVEERRPPIAPPTTIVTKKNVQATMNNQNRPLTTKPIMPAAT
jgi:hypothetical protein